MHVALLLTQADHAVHSLDTTQFTSTTPVVPFEGKRLPVIEGVGVNDGTVDTDIDQDTVGDMVTLVEPV